MSETVHVELGERSYPIHIGSGLLRENDLVRSAVSASQVFILSNDTVAPLYLETITSHFDDRECRTFTISDGEAYKNLESFERVLTAMLEHRLERSACLLALGGGVIGDLGGFAAASYQRGIDFVQIPTTLLAQVDSSVGGKTAVNHPLAKNMIGAFHQPSAVIADIDTLLTLPARELSAGIAEIVKYGMIRDHALFEWLESNMEALVNRDTVALSYAIRRSCENKADIVAADEREAGVRAILNFGHTFGHAIEAAKGYGEWLHGEAIAAGMCMAARFSTRVSETVSNTDVERLEQLLQRAALPTRPPTDITAAKFLELMSRDKKNEGGRIRFIVLDAIGSARATREYDDRDLDDTLARFSSSAD